jgi:hypothetical protein
LNKVKENLQINGFYPLTPEQRQDGPEACFEERRRVSEDFRSSFGSQNVDECRTCSQTKTGVSGELCNASVSQLDWERCTTEEIDSPEVILASGKHARCLLRMSGFGDSHSIGPIVDGF